MAKNAEPKNLTCQPRITKMNQTVPSTLKKVCHFPVTHNLHLCFEVLQLLTYVLLLESSSASFSGGACIVFHTFLTHGICFLWHLCVLELLSESLHTLSLCLSCLSLCLSCLSLCVSSFSAWLPIVTNLSVKFPGLKLRVCKKKTKIRYASLL